MQQQQLQNAEDAGHHQGQRSVVETFCFFGKTPFVAIGRYIDQASRYFYVSSRLMFLSLHMLAISSMRSADRMP